MDNIIGTSPVIAVLRAADASDYAPVVETLINNQVTTIELTLTTPRTLELLPELMAQFQDRAHIGVGTVLNAQDAETALSAGAKFIIAPNFNAEVLKVAGECQQILDLLGREVEQLQKASARDIDAHSRSFRQGNWSKVCHVRIHSARVKRMGPLC